MDHKPRKIVNDLRLIIFFFVFEVICALLALRPISHFTKKTLCYLHSTKIEQMTKTMVDDDNF